MSPRKFKEILDQIPRLTPVQKQRLMHGVQTSVKCDELPEPVRQREAELDRLRVCTHYGSSGSVRHGKSAGLCRFRCRSASCGRTFHALTGPHLAGLRHKSKWSVFEGCLRDRLTLHQPAERCGISYRTAFLWRHRLLGKQQKGSKLQGIVEMDETYFLESCKGDRSLTERRLPRERGGNLATSARLAITAWRRLPRERGGNRGHRGLVSDQRPVLTAVSRGGPTDMEALPSTAGTNIAPVMSEGLAEDGVCVTDGHPSYAMASRSPNMHQEVVRVSRREARRGSWHLNTVNQRHMTMKKRWLNHHHRGVSTRYLNHYMHWLMRSEFKLEQSIEADFLSPHLAKLYTSRYIRA